MSHARKPFITLCATALLTLFNTSFAQDVTDPKQAQMTQVPAVIYDLPKQKLTGEITYKTLIGNIARDRGQLDLAYEAYMNLASQTRDPRYAELAFKVATVAQQPSSAVTAALALNELAPNATVGQDLVLSAKIAVAYQHVATQEYRPAYEIAKSILKQNPKNPEALNLMVDTADRLGYTQEALKAAETALSLDPENPEAQNNLGYFLANKNLRLNEAEQLIQKANTAKPNSPHILDSLGWVNYRQGLIDEAVTPLRQASIIEPNDDTLTHLGEVLWQKGEREAAIKLFKEAFALNAFSEILRRTLERLAIPLSAVNVAPHSKKAHP